MADDGLAEPVIDRPEAEAVRPSLDPFDPVALERRLVAARERRAQALAARKAAGAPEDGVRPGVPVPLRPVPERAPAKPVAETAVGARPVVVPPVMARPAVARPVVGPVVRPLDATTSRGAARPAQSTEEAPVAAPPVVRPVLRAEERVAAPPARRSAMWLPFALGLAASVAAAALFVVVPGLRSGGEAPVAAVPAPVEPVAPAATVVAIAPPAEIPAAGPEVPSAAEAPALPPAAALPSAAPPAVPAATATALPREPVAPADGMTGAPAVVAVAAPDAPDAAPLEGPAVDAAPVAEAAPAAAAVLAAVLPLVTPVATAPEPTSRTRVAYFPPAAPRVAPPVIALAQAGFGTGDGVARAGLRFDGPAAADPLAGWAAAATTTTPRAPAKAAPVRQAESARRAPPAAAPAASAVPVAGMQTQRAVLNAQVEDLLKDRIRGIRRR